MGSVKHNAPYTNIGDRMNNNEEIMKNFLKSVDVKKVKHKSGKTFEKIIKDESKRFKNILYEVIQEYYDSYRPKFYKRLNQLKRKVFDDDDLEINFTSNGFEITCNIKQNKNVIHHSIINGKPSNALALISEGWKVSSKNWFHKIYRFGYYEGFDIFGKAKERFYAKNPYGIKINIILDGIYY